MQLSDEENKRLIRRPTQNHEAYHLLVKGSYYADKWTTEGLGKGLARFEELLRRVGLPAWPVYSDRNPLSDIS